MGFQHVGTVVKPPPLKDFQKTGAAWLARRTRAILADDMRLGKTWQVITAAKRLRAKRVRVICPAGARLVWVTALRQLAPKARAFTTTGRVDPNVNGPGWQIISYDEARIHRQKLYDQGQFDILVIDESHYLKEPGAQRTKAILGKEGLSWKAHYIWALSGTPKPNHAGELWIWARCFGLSRMRWGDWLRRYCVLDQRGNPRRTKPNRAKELRDLFSPMVLRRLKSEVAKELPPTLVERVPVYSSSEFLHLVDPVGNERTLARARAEYHQLRENIRRVPVGDRGQWLLQNNQSFATVRRVQALLKAPWVYRTIRDEIRAGAMDRVVVFAYHRDVLEILHTLLREEAQIGAELVYGSIAPTRRDAAVKRFSRPRKPTPVFLGQIISAGTAIDLSASNHGILIERDWVPANNAQALDRMGGFKQTKPVSIREIYTPDSIDDIIHEVTEHKSSLARAIFD